MQKKRAELILQISTRGLEDKINSPEYRRIKKKYENDAMKMISVEEIQGKVREIASLLFFVVAVC